MTRKIPATKPAKKITKTAVAPKPTQLGRPVIVTTEHKGVFFGYAEDTDGETIKLMGARMCLYWCEDVGSFMGLAAVGPLSGSKIGRRADITLRNITAVLEMTDTAVKCWEAFP